MHGLVSCPDDQMKKDGATTIAFTEIEGRLIDKLNACHLLVTLVTAATVAW